MGSGAENWLQVVDDTSLSVSQNDRDQLIGSLNSIGPNFGVPRPIPTRNRALLNRLLKHCPCLFTQIEETITADGVVHLCEIALNARIDSENVQEAFKIQHPGDGDYGFKHVPLVPGAGVGSITEGLCSEVLDNEGIPHVELDSEGWPVWKSTCHISLNKGKMNALKTYGDILIPCAPTNILISVKTEAARERLLVSGNRFESIGFGFFNEPHEFWAESKIKMYKRMGFTAIYMLDSTVEAIYERLNEQGKRDVAININGTNLYRPLHQFGSDMRKVAGKSSLDL